MIKIFICDVDGTLTDSKVYYSKHGRELLSFNVKDGYGISLLKEKGIRVLFLSNTKSKIIKQRAKDLKVEYSYTQDKEQVIFNILSRNTYNYDDIAYIGDDMNDFYFMQYINIVACPNDAHEEIKKLPNVKVMVEKVALESL